jgi:uncharacterized membrane protein
MFSNIFKKEKGLYAVITLAGIVGFLASFLQMIEKIELLKNPNSALFCNINAVFSCSNILNVWQSSVFGFPNSLMCVSFFAIMITAGIIGWTGSSMNKKLRLIFMGMSLFFVGFGFWYLWQSIFVVGALCIYCIFCYAAVLSISAAWLRLNRHDLKLNKKNEKFLGNIISKNFDVAFWLLIAIIIIIEAVIKFA